MKAADVSPSEEFLLGRLSTPASRLEEARQERRGFVDLAVMEPLDPRPDEPIRLCFRGGVDVSRQRMIGGRTPRAACPLWSSQAVRDEQRY